MLNGKYKPGRSARRRGGEPRDRIYPSFQEIVMTVHQFEAGAAGAQGYAIN